jgi:hypothetical protein
MAKRIIGVTDFLDVVDYGIENLSCKIDTGADTSAIHCERVRIKEINGKEYLSFKLLDRKHPLYTGKEILTLAFKERKIRSSFGDYEYRYQVRLTIRLFEQDIVTAFNLSNRKNMKYPALIGKRTLRNRFLVDVAKKDLSYRAKTEQ